MVGPIFLRTFEVEISNITRNEDHADAFRPLNRICRPGVLWYYECWYTDIEATRQLAAALVALLLADPDFLDMIAAARAEYVGVTTGVTPAGRLSPSSSPSSSQVYRLDGIPATDSTHSIVIENGQKIVRTTKEYGRQ